MELKNFEKDWTHKKVTITDIRKLYQLFIFTIDIVTIEGPLFVNEQIFYNVLKSYYMTLKEDFTRSQILDVKWNMYITKGYYIKLNESGEVVKHNQDENKYYVSYLEICGALGTFCSVYRDKE